MSTRVKICGITSVEDARHALQAGADAIGLVFYDKSPRFVETDVARQISAAVGPFVTLVGLFVNASAEQVNKVLGTVPLQVLQFHGDESSDFCRQFGRPWYKAIRMAPDLGVAEQVQAFGDSHGLLFDAWQADKYGGTGATFEWQRIPAMNKPVILAGGLTPENVVEAVKTVRPYAVDISGGVESSPGKKCPQKMQQFIERAKSA
ncbi:phosphoribosylanthranilate isomerase [Porticoccus sp. W117]|uniref:phosphoribosylanthranilate isomerase n=1 Tax=Porticoccus sp. W117 TaxID=3054777 RepID=UPI0025936D64|nr:phosphoribosylanthranilate isomerase [Porticoccus sp. W117]MDM3871668.1 phosphoribosylanthranilate isomerase [Porticoccus sp. W117]